MSITVNGQPIHGTHGLAIKEPAEFHSTKTYYWGLYGETEDRGGPGGIPITMSIWLHNKYNTRQKLETAIDDIGRMVGDHGVLKVLASGTWSTYHGVTCHGFQRTAFASRQEADPAFDFTNSIGGGWVQEGTLSFYQLEYQYNA